MALPNNPTPAELVKAVKALEQGGGGSATDVQVDDVSQVVNGVANLKTKNGNYNASTNKLVTENDLANKLSRYTAITTFGTLYGKEPDGTQNNYLFDIAATAQTIVRRNSAGCIFAKSTSNMGDDGLINKSYAETNFVTISSAQTVSGNKTFSGTNNFTGTFQIGGTGVSDFVVEKGTGYIRWNSGIQICWERVLSNVTGDYQVTFPKSFKSGTYPAVATTFEGASGTSNYYSYVRKDTLSNTGCKMRASNNTYMGYTASGVWK